MKTVTSKTFLILATFLFFVSIYIENAIPAGQLFKLLTLCMMLAAYLSWYGWEVESPFEIFPVYIFVFLCYCIFSMLFVAEDPSLTFGIVRGMIFILIMFTVVWLCHCRDTGTDTFLKITMYGGYTVVVFFILRYGWGTILKSLSSNSRLTNEFLNANTLGMCAAYAIVINIYYILYEKRLRITDLAMLPSMVLLAASGSRKALVIVVVGVFGIFMLWSIRNDRISNIVFKIGAVLVVFAAGLLVISRMSIFASLLKRMKALIALVNGRATRRTAGYIRLVYVRIGMELFHKHPVFGIGIANAYHYIKQYNQHIHLHNNYAELLACGGLAGFILYYWIYVYILVQFLRFRKYRDGAYDICLVLLLIRLAMNYGSVSYYGGATYFFLLMMMIEVRRLKEKAQKGALESETDEETDKEAAGGSDESPSSDGQGKRIHKRPGLPFPVQREQGTVPFHAR